MTAWLAVQAAGATQGEHVRLFRKGLEVSDFEKWRVAAEYFSEALDADPSDAPEASRKDIQIYGQRWVPYLPHFFLGIGLFEIGRYESAELEWRRSEEQLALVPQARRRRILTKYKRARSREHRFADRLVEEISLQRGFIDSEIGRAEGSLGKIRRAGSALGERAERELVERLEAIVARLRDTREAMAAMPEPAPAGEVLPLDPERFASIRRRFAELVRLERTLGVVDAEIGELSRLVERQLLGRLEGEGAVAVGVAVAGRNGVGRRRLALSGPAPVDEVLKALSDYATGELLLATGSHRYARQEALPRLEASRWLAERREELAASLPPALAELLRRASPHEALLRVYRLVGDRARAETLLGEARGALDPAVAANAEHWLRGAPDSAFAGANHALLIGVWDYGPEGDDPDQAWPDLPGVRRDFEEMKALLEHLRFRVLALANPRTEREIEDAMDEISTRLEPEDRLLVYYAGHGYRTEFVGWLVPSAALPSSHRDFRDGLLDMEEWQRWAIKTLTCRKAHHKLFIIDSCFSGAALTELQHSKVRLFEEACGPRAGEPAGDAGDPASPTGGYRGLQPALGGLMRGQVSSLIEKKYARPNVFMLSAGTSEQRVPDESIFRHELVKALRTPPPGVVTDGFVVGARLALHLEERVYELSGGEQSPQYRRLAESGDWVFEVQGIESESDAAPHPDELLVLGEVRRWEEHLRSGTYLEYLQESPEGPLAELARAILEAGAAAPSRLDS